MKNRISGWTSYLVITVLAILIPLGAIFFHLFKGPGETWGHISGTLLPTYVINSAILVVAIGILTIVIGVSTAWLVTKYNFTGRRLFEWALILPLSIPSYIIAYTYAGIFDYTGPVQILFRKWFPGAVFTFEIMNIYGIIVLLSFVLYPYVFATARASFLQQSTSFLEAGQMLGCSRRQLFWKLALPMSRPAIVGGVSLVIMEVLNDYGAVIYFGVPTFTTGIFRAWFSLEDLPSAIFLAAILLGFVFVLLSIERYQRRQKLFDQVSTNNRPAQIFNLTGLKNWVAFIVCFLPLLIGFIIPIIQLVYWTMLTYHKVINEQFWILIGNSFVVAFTTSLLAVIICMFLIYSVKLSRLKYSSGFSRMAKIGYAVPGAVIAIGVMLPILAFDKALVSTLKSWFNYSGGFLITGTILILIYGYIVRFLAVAYNPVDDGYKKIGWQLTEASRMLGKSPFHTLFKVNIPLLKTALLSSGLLVFVDVMKELPLTLILRPFNFHTLATKTFELAGDELIAESANSSLVIILTGIIPIFLMSKLISKQQKS